MTIEGLLRSIHYGTHAGTSHLITIVISTDCDKVRPESVLFEKESI